MLKAKYTGKKMVAGKGDRVSVERKGCVNERSMIYMDIE